MAWCARRSTWPRPTHNASGDIPALWSAVSRTAAAPAPPRPALPSCWSPLLPPPGAFRDLRRWLCHPYAAGRHRPWILTVMRPRHPRPRPWRVSLGWCGRDRCRQVCNGRARLGCDRVRVLGGRGSRCYRGGHEDRRGASVGRASPCATPRPVSAAAGDALLVTVHVQLLRTQFDANETRPEPRHAQHGDRHRSGQGVAVEPSHSAGVGSPNGENLVVGLRRPAAPSGAVVGLAPS